MMLGKALLAGGGLGDMLDPMLSERIILDLVFFIVVTVGFSIVLFNIVRHLFGVTRR
jgi:lipoprotein signal peptidase